MTDLLQQSTDGVPPPHGRFGRFLSILTTYRSMDAAIAPDSSETARFFDIRSRSGPIPTSGAQNMVTNTVALPQELWGNAQSDIMQVRNLSNTASLLSGNAGSIVTRLQSASGYASQAANLGNVANQFTTWQQTIGTNVSTLGRTLGLQQGQEATNATLMTTLESHSESAQGQMQAIQAGNELAHANAVQLQEIQATLSATAQMQATGMAVDTDRRAAADAAMLHFSTPQAIQTSGYPNY